MCVGSQISVLVTYTGELDELKEKQDFSDSQWHSIARESQRRSIMMCFILCHYSKIGRYLGR